MKFDIGVYTTWMKIYNWILRKKCPHRSYSGPHFPAFGLNTERCGVSLHIQSECGKTQSRITPNTDNFPAAGYIFNPVKWIKQNHPVKWNKNKVKKSSKTRYYQKTLILAFAQFLNAITKVLFLERRLGIFFCLHPNLGLH